MKILAYSHNFHPTIGGIVTYCHTLCATLTARGEELVLFTPDPEDTREFPYPVIKMNKALAHDRIATTGYLETAKTLKETVRRFRPDILWCCNLDTLYVVALTHIDTAVVITLHGSEISKNFGSRNPVKWIRSRLIKRALNRADRIITVSQYTRALAVRHLPQFLEKIDVVHNGIVPADSKVFSVVERQQKKTGTDITLLSVGRLAEFKGFHLFPKVLSHLVQRAPGIKWVIAGEGEFRNVISNSVKRLGLQDHVTFLGWVDPEPLSALYKNADLMVHPAVTDREGRDESFGMILVEAMMQGCPVAVTGAGGTGEIIQDGKNGIVFDVRDPVTAGEKIAGYLDDEKRLKAVAYHGQQYALAHFTLHTCAEKTLKSMRKAVQKFSNGEKCK